jgi:hypothetical protein
MRLTKYNYYEMVSLLREKQKGICPICNKLLNGKIDIHHAKVHNTKWAKIHVPLLLNDEINLVLLHHSCHINNSNYGRVSDYEAEELEQTLQSECDFAYYELKPFEEVIDEKYYYDEIRCNKDNKICEKQCCKKVIKTLDK